MASRTTKSQNEAMATLERSDDVVTGERERRLEDLAVSYRIFGAMRWGDLGDGHITARDPEHTDCMWLLRYGVPFDQATVDDLVLVGPDGTLVDSDSEINNTAHYIHRPLHDARPDIVAAAHTHTPWGTPLSAERRLIEPISQEACLFYGAHSLFDDEEIDIRGLPGGERIAAALGSNHSIILANHGLLTVGTSVASAVGAFVTMERAAEAQMKARNAIPISDEAAETTFNHMHSGPTFERIFRFLAAKHVPGCATSV